MDKQVLWDDTRKRVDIFRDALNMPVDNGIKETVVVLNVLGFNTSMSCEGHMNRGNPFPWVSIKFNKMELVGVNVMSDVLKMISLLEEFYESRRPLPYARITISQTPASFRIHSIAGKLAKNQKLKGTVFLETFYTNSVKEMRAFTEFLKQKFWNNTI